MLNVDLVGAVKFNIQHSTFNTPYINTPTGFLLQRRMLQALSCKHDHQPRYILFPAFRHPSRYCFSAGTLGKGCGNGCGTGSCSASHCYSASPFPNSCPYDVCISYLCKFYVASLGKCLVSFQDFTIVGDVDGVDVIHEGNEMRITHANIGAFKFSAVSFEHRRAYELLGISSLGFSMSTVTDSTTSLLS